MCPKIINDGSCGVFIRPIRTDRVCGNVTGCEDGFIDFQNNILTIKPVNELKVLI
jgi:hypothetical protein